MPARQTATVDQQRLDSIAQARHPFGAPISGVTVNRLLRRSDREPAARILELGCGAAGWALQALAHFPDGHADAVDLSQDALDRAAAAADARGLADRLTLHRRDARAYVPDGDYDLVICVGSGSAFGGLAGTLELAGRHVNRDGVLLVGERFWQAAPTPAALAGLTAAGDLTDLGGLVDAAERAGWTPVYAHVSEAGEWDHYEWSWIGALTEWALTEAPEEERGEALQLAREHRRQYLAGYRHELGFATVVLHDLGG
jgi:SAM-dependent methyltransferase